MGGGGGELLVEEVVGVVDVLRPSGPPGTLDVFVGVLMAELEVGVVELWLVVGGGATDIEIEILIGCELVTIVLVAVGDEDMEPVKRS